MNKSKWTGLPVARNSLFDGSHHLCRVDACVPNGGCAFSHAGWHLQVTKPHRNHEAVPSHTATLHPHILGLTRVQAGIAPGAAAVIHTFLNDFMSSQARKAETVVPRQVSIAHPEPHTTTSPRQWHGKHCHPCIPRQPHCASVPLSWSRYLPAFRSVEIFPSSGAKSRANSCDLLTNPSNTLKLPA